MDLREIVQVLRDYCSIEFKNGWPNNGHEQACFLFQDNNLCNNINGANFPAPDAHFDNTCLLYGSL